MRIELPVPSFDQPLSSTNCVHWKSLTRTMDIPPKRRHTRKLGNEAVKKRGFHRPTAAHTSSDSTHTQNHCPVKIYHLESAFTFGQEVGGQICHILPHQIKNSPPQIKNFSGSNQNILPPQIKSTTARNISPYLTWLWFMLCFICTTCTISSSLDTLSNVKCQIPSSF